jgi:hypothetical protein
MSESKPMPDDPAQSQRFIDMAREVEADATSDAFNIAVMKVAQLSAGKPEPKKPKK